MSELNDMNHFPLGVLDTTFDTCVDRRRCSEMTMCPKHSFKTHSRSGWTLDVRSGAEKHSVAKSSFTARFSRGVQCSPLLNSCTRLLKLTAGDLHETVNRLVARGVALSIDGKVYDPADPMGKMFIGMLGLMAEFESDLIRARTRDAIAAAAAAGKMKGRPHTLTPEERAYLLQVYETRQFKVETLCKNTGLKRSALYSNLTLAREERNALTGAGGE